MLFLSTKTKCTIILALFMLGLFFFLSEKYLVVSGRLEFEYDMARPIPYLSVVPTDRLSAPIYQDGRVYQTVLGEPIYFDARVPRAFDTADIELTYSNAGQNDIKLGGVVSRRDESFILQNVEKDLNEHGIRAKTITMSLTPLEYGYHKYRFLLSMPGVDENKQVRLYHLKFVFQRPAMSLNDIWNMRL